MLWDQELHNSHIGKANSPFFCSAWGLAIHQKSRIIAVTSNRKHITIFVNSYSDTSKEVMLNDEDVDVSADDRKFPMMDTFEPLPTSFRDQDRRHNYRIVLTFGDHGANMPSIDFISGAEGEAEEIITTDINGTAVSYSSYSSLHSCHKPVRIHLMRDYRIPWLCMADR